MLNSSINSKEKTSFLKKFPGSTANCTASPSWHFLKLLGYAPGGKVYIFTQPSRRVYELVLTESGFTAQLTKKIKGEEGEEGEQNLARELVGRVYSNGQSFLTKLTTGVDPQNIFIIPNRHEGGIGKDFFKGAPALFFEIDDVGIDEQTTRINGLVDHSLSPTAVVFSGSKSLHTYYRLDGEISETEWVELQKLLIAVTDSDPAIKNVSRQMRLPGVIRPGKDSHQTLCYTNPDASYTPHAIKKILLGFLPCGLSDDRWRDYIAARNRRDGSHNHILSLPEAQLPSVIERAKWEKRRLDRPVNLNAVSTSFSDALGKIDQGAKLGDFVALGATPAKGAGNRCACPIHKKGKSGTSGYFKYNKNGELALGCNAGCGGLRTLTQVEKALRFGLNARVEGKEFIDFCQGMAEKYGVTVTPTVFTRSISTPTLTLGKTLPHVPDPQQLAILKNQTININVPGTLDQKTKDAIALYHDAGVRVLVNTRDWRLVQTDYLVADTLPPSIEYNTEYLPPGAFSKTKWEDKSVLAVKSGTGTGKTEQLNGLFREYQAEGQPVTILTHRQNLAKELERRTGVKYIDSRQLINGNAIGVVDSFHSDGKFDLPLPQKGTLVIDEAEQFFIHAVDSSTDIRKKRCEVLKNLAVFIKNLDLVVLDAHLSDLTVNLIKSLKGIESSGIRYIKNNFKKSWRNYSYNTKSPDGLISNFLSKVGEVSRGFLKKKLLFLTDAQEVDSKTGTKNIASLIIKRYPNLKVLRIDKETIKQWDAAALLEEIAKNDVIICSPSIATGWDLNLKGVFDSVWGCFNGVLTVATIRQFLARLRDLDVPRHIWVNNIGIGGSNAYTVNAVIKDLNKSITAAVTRISAQDDLSLLSNMDDLQVYTAFTTFFAGYKARDAAERVNYRKCLIDELIQDGGEVIEVDDVADPGTWEEVNQHRDAQQLKEREKILDSTLITQRLYDSIKSRGPANDDEIYQLKLFELHSKYGIYPSKMTLDLLEFDHSFGHIPLRNRYLLTSPTGDEQVKMQDAAIVSKMRSDNRFFAPDVAKKLIAEKITLLKKLGVMQLTQLEKMSHLDPMCAEVAENAKKVAPDLSRLFGLSIHAKMPPTSVCNKLLQLVGWGKGTAKRFKRAGVFYTQWEVIDRAIGIPTKDIYEAWEKKYENMLNEMTPTEKSLSNQFHQGETPTFVSDAPEFEPTPPSTVSRVVGVESDFKTVDNRGEAVEAYTTTEKSGSYFTIYKNISGNLATLPDEEGQPNDHNGGANPTQVQPTQTNMDQPTRLAQHVSHPYGTPTYQTQATPPGSITYQVGDRVYYYSMQRGGVWVPATIIGTRGTNPFIKMDNSILEILVWEPARELAPLAA